MGERDDSAAVVIARDDPRAEDVRLLLQTHLAFSRDVTPAEYSFALDAEGLSDPGVTLFCARHNGELLGIGAQRAAILQAGQMNTAPATLVQLPQQLQSLALTAALLKTVNDE